MMERNRIGGTTPPSGCWANVITVLAVILCFYPYVAKAGASERPSQTKGLLNILYGDPPPRSKGKRAILYMLTDKNGRRSQLLLDKKETWPLGGPMALNRKQVMVDGSRVAPSSSNIRVNAIALDKSTISSSASPMTTVVTGAQPWVTILCRFSDSTGVTPHDLAWFDTLMGSTYPGLDHYWRDLSYNNVHLTGSVQAGWYNLPHPRSYYVYDRDGNGVPDLDFERITDDCTAVADPDVFFPNFVGVNMMFNQDLDCCAWGGGGPLARDGVTRNYNITWMPPWGYKDQFVLGHEMGHGFGLPHSSGPYSQTYDSKWDPMSGGGVCNPPHAGYGCVGPHTISYHKHFLGWIPPARKYVATPGMNQAITIERLGQPISTNNYLMAQIPIDTVGTQFYTVEARQFASYDDQIPGEAIVIHKVDTTRGDREAQVVDADNNGNPNDAGAMWTPGETFTDTANRITVSVVSRSQSSFNIIIDKPALPPPPPGVLKYGMLDNTTGGVTATFPFIELFGAGMPIFRGVWDDGVSSSVPIGFSFPFHGESFKELFVGTNGQVFFDAGAYGYFTNRTIPSTSGNNNYLSPFWDDLYSGSEGVVLTALLSPCPIDPMMNCRVVEWHDVGKFDAPSDRYTFEAVLFPDGRILFQYKSMTGTFADGRSATIGIENKEGNGGLIFGFNAPVLPTGAEINFDIQFALGTEDLIGSLYGDIGSSVRFSGEFIDALGLAGDPYRFALDFGDGGLATTISGISYGAGGIAPLPELANTYTRSGTFTASSVVTNARGGVLLDPIKIVISGALPLTIRKAGLGTGTVTSTPLGIACGSNCSQVYFSNTEVSLNAAPDLGSAFVGWSGDCTGGVLSTTVTMNTDKNCTATFVSSKPTLTVTKILIPSDDTGKFNLLVNGVVKASNVGNGGSTGAIIRNPGFVSVSETAGIGVSLGSYERVIGGDCAPDGAITLISGDNKTCTITSQRKPMLTVKKILTPSDDMGTFNLLVNGVVKAVNVSNNGSTGAIIRNPGFVSVSETAGIGVSLGSYEHVIGGDCAPDGAITLVFGDNKTCTITSQRKPMLTVKKVLIPSADTGKFNLLVNGVVKASNVSNNGTTGAIIRNPGFVSVSETAGTGTNLGSYERTFSGDCAADGTMTLTFGDNKTCTITNTRR